MLTARDGSSKLSIRSEGLDLVRDSSKLRNLNIYDGANCILIYVVLGEESNLDQ